MNAPSMASLEGSAWDVVISGAGPAGACAAISAARRGLRTLLVDRALFPRDKVCGCCLTRAGVGVLEELGVRATLSDKLGALLSSVEIRRGGASARFRSPGHAMVRRRDLDAALAAEARSSGAVFVAGASVRFLGDGSGAVLETSRASCRVAARACIVADGLSGSSARDVEGLGWRVRRGSYVGIGCSLDAMCADAPRDVVTMCVAREGYVGIAPLACGGWALAGAVTPRFVRREGSRGALRCVLDGCGVGVGSLDAVELHGAPALTRTRERVESRGRVFCVGDAAGYVEPFTGEGMTWAMRGGIRLAGIVRSVVDGSCEHGVWTRMVSRRGLREKRGCRVVRAALRRPWIVSGAIGLGRVSPTTAGWLAALTLRGSSKAVVA